jgi:carbamoyl-phosphate synthase large subunit
MRSSSGKPSRVLVTGCGGPSAVSFMRAADGVSIEFYAADIDPYAPGLYLVEPERRLLLPRGESPEFARAVLERCRERQIDVLVPTVDSELIPLASIRSEFAAAGTKLLLAPAPALRLCLDKWALSSAMDDTVPMPRCEIWNERLDRSSWTLPAIVKPRRGSGSRGVRLIERWEQLGETPMDDDELLQEYLPGPEFSLDVLASQAGDVRAVVPRARLKLDSGIAITSRTVHDPDLQALGRRAAELVGICGVANVQVKEDAGGVHRLVEINPRFPGTMPLTVASGINMPRLALHELLGTLIPPGELAFRDLAMVRYLQGVVVEVDELVTLEAAGAQAACVPS